MSRTYQIQDKLAASISTKLGKTQTGFSNLEPDERMERLITIIYRKIQQLHKKETNITLKKKCQQVIESLENLYSKAEVISPPREDQNPYERGGNLTDISSIKGNSKVINVSNLSLIAPADYTYEDYKENDIMKELLGQEKTTRTQITLPGNETKRGEFSFENLKTIEKEQFGKIMAMFNDIKPQDEHICDKLDAIGTFIEKANMEVIQACQNSVIKMLKKTLLNNATDPRNILRIFESGNNVLIKINKICLEILPETLKTELKMLMILANVLNNKSVEKTLDSIYMTCSLEKFLGNTLDLFEKVDTKYVGLISEAKLANSLRIYLNWLVLKVEKIQNVMFGEGTLKELEQGISQFRFSNLPQVHLGLVNVLNKKIGAIETSRDQGNQSIRSYETPRIARRNKPASLDPQSVMGLMEFGAHHHHSVEKDQQQIALRMKHVKKILIISKFNFKIDSRFSEK